MDLERCSGSDDFRSISQKRGVRKMHVHVQVREVGCAVFYDLQYRERYEGGGSVRHYCLLCDLYIMAV